jgi:hypothetical protein
MLGGRSTYTTRHQGCLRVCPVSLSCSGRSPSRASCLRFRRSDNSCGERRRHPWRFISGARVNRLGFHHWKLILYHTLMRCSICFLSSLVLCISPIPKVRHLPFHCCPGRHCFTFAPATSMVIYCFRFQSHCSSTCYCLCIQISLR